MKAPRLDSVLKISTTCSSCWRLRLPLRWLRQSKMSLGSSGTVSWRTRLTWMIQISSETSFAHLRLAHEVEDGGFDEKMPSQ